MPISELITATGIHLLVPLLGLWLFIRSCSRLRDKGATGGHFAMLFALFFCYGGLVLILLTGLFWKWSGMASFGMFFLLLVAPFLMIAIAINLFIKPSVQPFERQMRLACLIYCPLVAGVFGLFFLFL